MVALRNTPSMASESCISYLLCCQSRTLCLFCVFSNTCSVIFVCLSFHQKERDNLKSSNLLRSNTCFWGQCLIALDILLLPSALSLLSSLVLYSVWTVSLQVLWGLPQVSYFGKRELSILKSPLCMCLHELCPPRTAVCQSGLGDKVAGQ